MKDKVTVITILKILDSLQGNMLTEDMIYTYLNIELPALVTAEQLRESIRFAQDKGWIDYKVDEFSMKKWWITEAGQIQLRKR